MNVTHRSSVLSTYAVSTAFAAFFCGSQVAAQDSFNDFFWSSRITTGFDYSSGTYGQAESTKISYVPVTVQSARGPITFKLSGGWLAVSGPALILDGAATTTTTPAVSRKVSGLADTSLAVMYSLEQLYDDGIYIDFTLRTKLPTASFSKGLGTGEVDGAVQVDGAFAWGDVMPFATLGYKLNGTPQTFALRDVAFASIGVQYTWTDLIATGVVYDYRQSSVRTSSDPQEGMAYISYKFTDDWSLNLYGMAGFSANSPKAGGGLTFTYRLKPGGVPVL